MSQSDPTKKSGPPVRIRCRSEEQIARELRRRANSDSLFIPSQAPPPPGSTQEFLFYVPDGKEVRVEAQVLESIPPGAGSTDMPGMLVSFGADTAGAADSIDDNGEAALDRRTRARRARTAIMPGPRESQTLHCSAEQRRILEALEAELAAMHGKTDHQLLYLEANADLPTVQAAYSRLSAQYERRHFSAHGSPAVLEMAERIAVLLRQAYRRLTGAARSHKGGPVQLSLTPREREHSVVSDAAALLAGKAYVNAQRTLREALDRDPDDRDARIWMLIAQAQQAEEWQDYATAQERYRAALSLDREHEVACRGLTRAAQLGASSRMSNPAGALRRKSRP